MSRHKNLEQGQARDRELKRIAARFTNRLGAAIARGLEPEAAAAAVLEEDRAVVLQFLANAPEIVAGFGSLNR